MLLIENINYEEDENADDGNITLCAGDVDYDKLKEFAAWMNSTSLSNCFHCLHPHKASNAEGLCKRLEKLLETFIISDVGC